MEKFSLLLMIAAIVCASFSDKIDMAVKGDKQVKKVIIVFRDCSATCEALQSEHKRARYGIIHARKNEGIARKACIWDGGADV